METRNELFVVEREESGEWIDVQGDGGFSCFTTRAEAQDTLESEADSSDEDPSLFRVVKFSRDAVRP